MLLTNLKTILLALPLSVKGGTIAHFGNKVNEFENPRTKIDSSVNALWFVI